MHSEQSILRIPDNIRKETLTHRGQVERFLRGEMSPVFFRAYRVPMGIYEQRTSGRYMVRIRIGAGLVLPHQLKRIAELSKLYGNGIVHVTTRQDMQIHDVDIKDTPEILEGLLEAGLSSRGGGGNTVRNITACPRAGVCPKETFDTAPYAIALAEYLLQFGSSYNLPRKFKIAFSGCSDDCGFASAADLGFFAHVRNGAKGFAVYAGGGLGPNPSIGIKIEDFIADDEIFEVAEAVKKLFDKYGDRSNKHKARLRYVPAQLGRGQFIKLYEDERAQFCKRSPLGVVPKIRDITDRFRTASPQPYSGSIESCFIDLLPEKTSGLYTVGLKLNLGDIPADDLVKVAGIAERFGCGLVRTTQLQDILITSVPGQNIDGVLEAIKQLSINVSTNSCPKIVVCRGASTCKLGLCLSCNLANAISKELCNAKLSRQAKDRVIRISGCPNSCGNHHIADVGFEGQAKRVNDRMMPFYNVLAGATVREGETKLAEKLGSLPAKMVPQLVAELFSEGIANKQQISDLLSKMNAACAEPPEDYYYDFGETKPFSLAGRGPGECGAGVMDVIRIDIDYAKEAIKAAEESDGNKNEHLYKATVAGARALLVLFGLEPKKDREIFSAFTEQLIKPGWVRPETGRLLDAAIDWRIGERNSIDDLTGQVGQLIERVEALFLSLDADLKFRIEPYKEAAEISEPAAGPHKIDLRGVACPLNFVKAKLELEKINTGDILEVLLDEGEPIRNVPASFAEQGQDVVEIEKRQNYYSVKVRRKK